MSKWRTLAEPRCFTVEAVDSEDAQLKAFALYVRDLSPSDITVWEAKPGDPWEEKP